MRRPRSISAICSISAFNGLVVRLARARRHQARDRGGVRRPIVIEFARAWVMRPGAGPRNHRRRADAGGRRHHVCTRVPALALGEPAWSASMRRRCCCSRAPSRSSWWSASRTVEQKPSRVDTAVREREASRTWLAGRRAGGRSAAGADGRRARAHSGSAPAQPRLDRRLTSCAASASPHRAA